MAYNYNTVKSKVEPQQASIIVLVGCWPAQEEPTTRLAAHSLIRNGLPWAQRCSSSANISMSCASQPCGTEKQSPENNLIPVFLMGTHCEKTHARKLTKAVKWNKLFAHKHWDIKASASTRGLTVWKRSQQVTMACQESAGGILACLSEHAELGVSGSHSFNLSLFSLPQWKDLPEGRRKWNTGGPELEMSYSRETGCTCVCCWGRGSCALSSSALSQH